MLGFELERVRAQQAVAPLFDLALGAEVAFPPPAERGHPAQPTAFERFDGLRQLPDQTAMVAGRRAEVLAECLRQRSGREERVQVDVGQRARGGAGGAAGRLAIRSRRTAAGG